TPSRSDCETRSRRAAVSISASELPAASWSPRSPPSFASRGVWWWSRPARRRRSSPPCHWGSSRAAARPRWSGWNASGFAPSVTWPRFQTRYQPFDTLSRQATLPYPTERDDQLASALRHLLETQLDPSRAVRLIGAGVSNLEPCATQLSLLETRSSRLAMLDEQLDELRGR